MLYLIWSIQLAIDIFQKNLLKLFQNFLSVDIGHICMGLLAGIALVAAATISSRHSINQRVRNEMKKYPGNHYVQACRDTIMQIRSNKRDDRGTTIYAYIQKRKCNFDRAVYNLAYWQCYRNGIEWDDYSAHLLCPMCDAGMNL